MERLILRTLICALGGSVSAAAGLLWLKTLLVRREKAYPLSRRQAILLCLAMLIPGGAAGVLTDGIVPALASLLLIAVCLTVCVADGAYRLIPNPAVLMIFVIALAGGIPTLCGVPGFLRFSLWRSFAGLAVCFLLFSLPGLFGKNVGAGDIKLAGAMGFLLGLYPALIGLMIMGLLVIVYSIAQRKMPFLSFIKTQIPMGPFITVGLYTAFLLSEGSIV